MNGELYTWGSVREQAFFSSPLFDGGNWWHFAGFSALVDVLGMGSDLFVCKDVYGEFLRVYLSFDGSPELSPGNDLIPIDNGDSVYFYAIGKIVQDGGYMLLWAIHGALFRRFRWSGLWDRMIAPGDGYGSDRRQLLSSEARRDGTAPGMSSLRCRSGYLGAHRRGRLPE